MGLTVELLQRIAGGTRMLPTARALEVFPHVLTMLREAQATTRARAAAMLATVIHESGAWRYREEIASGDAYEGRVSLGNTQPGDGRRFKGRGPIQLTGRANYTAAARDLGLPLVEQPELVARDDIGARVAAWFWRTRGVNAPADREDLVGVTRIVNGPGLNGLEHRRELYERALSLLPEVGIVPPSAPAPLLALGALLLLGAA